MYLRNYYKNTISLLEDTTKDMLDNDFYSFIKLKLNFPCFILYRSDGITTMIIKSEYKYK